VVELCIHVLNIFVKLSKLEFFDYIIVKSLKEFLHIGDIEIHVVIGAQLGPDGILDQHLHFDAFIAVHLE
jgi:hypothetical protein